MQEEAKRLFLRHAQMICYRVSVRCTYVRKECNDGAAVNVCKRVFPVSDPFFTRDLTLKFSRNYNGNSSICCKELRSDRPDLGLEILAINMVRGMASFLAKAMS